MQESRPQPRQPIPAHAKAVFTGKIFTTYQWPQVQFDGSTTTFEIVRRADSVNVLPITADGKIMLTEQEQPGMAPFVSALGGKLDAGETARQAGERELLEEAGLRAGSLELWAVSQQSSYIDWASWTYIAKHCQRIAEPQPDQGERISIIEVSFDEYVQLVAEPRYRDRDIAYELMRAVVQGTIDDVRKNWLS